MSLISWHSLGCRIICNRRLSSESRTMPRNKKNEESITAATDGASWWLPAAQIKNAQPIDEENLHMIYTILHFYGVTSLSHFHPDPLNSIPIQPRYPCPNSLQEQDRPGSIQVVRSAPYTCTTTPWVCSRLIFLITHFVFRLKLHEPASQDENFLCTVGSSGF